MAAIGAGTAAFDDSRSSADLSALSQGDAATLTYSIVQDGTVVSSMFPEIDASPAETSDLISFLGTVVGSSEVGQDLVRSSFDRWSALSGLTLNEVDESLPITLPLGGPPFVGDIRIGGGAIDGDGGILAVAFFPALSGILVDTSSTQLFDNSFDDFRLLRNVVAHEIGHALGLTHSESNNSLQLLEPAASIAFDGPQLDDIRRIHRLYGDRFEADGGNDTLSDATFLTRFSGDATFEIGADANGGADGSFIVADTEVDFVSIDDDGDTDYFTFSLETAGLLDAVLSPAGPTVNLAPEDETQVAFDFAAVSDLSLELLDETGQVIAVSGAAGLGEAETLLGLSLGVGDYFFRVTGDADDTQLFQLQLGFTAVAVPEPRSVCLALLASTALLTRCGRKIKQPI